MEYQVELVQAKVTKVNADVSAQVTDTFQITTSQRASIFEPKAESDPTIMIRSDFSMADESKQMLSVDMEIEFIFKFDPIPEDKSAAASQYCPKLMADKSIDLASGILLNMGHKFVLGKL